MSAAFAPSDPVAPPRFPTRWVDDNHIEVDDLDDWQRETYKRNDDGFRLIHTTPLEEKNDGPADL